MSDGELITLGKTLDEADQKERRASLKTSAEAIYMVLRNVDGMVRLTRITADEWAGAEGEDAP